MRLIRTPSAVAAALAAATLVAGAVFGTAANAQPTAHASHAHLQVGIADEDPAMFTSAPYERLGLKISRYFLPYDVMVEKNPASLDNFEQWLAAAQTAGVQPLVAFYHNLNTATKMPSVATYTKDVTLFVKQFPQVTDLQPWNEVNRGNVRESSGNYDSPSPKQSAEYYLALKKVCETCTIVGLDVLDSTTPWATIDYINAFKRDVGQKNMPKIWGLHNYSDTNHFYDSGTKDVLNDVPGQVWLTETGGLAKLSPSFKFNLKRQKKATTYMFALADANPRISRLYIYSWFGGNAKKESFDAGLTNAKGAVRPAYCEVYEHLLGKKKCPYKTATN
jgi:hypothetical protein